MTEIIAILIPLMISLAGITTIVIGFGLVLTWQRVLLLGFIVCILVFASSSSYGLAEASDANVFWVKGTRTFFFSFVQIGLFGAWIAMLFRQAWHSSRDPWLPISKYYVGLAVLLAGQVLVGLLDPRHQSILDLSMRGYLGVLMQGMFVALVVEALRTQEDIRRVVLILLVALFARHVFGLVRYVALGGDPQNAYAVLENRGVKITFWDVNDSILAAVMFALCAWLLLTERALVPWQRAFLAMAGLFSLLIPMLSARRTGQSGMLMAIVLLAVLLPRGRKLPILLALCLSVPLVLITLGKRADSANVPILERVLIDVKSNPYKDPRRSRFHELRTAWQTIKEEPIFGVGPSGSFSTLDNTGLEYHGGSYDFVHSGFGHMLLKGGVVGFGLFSCIFFSWLYYVARGWKDLGGLPKALAVASCAGFTASLPTLLFGTPISEMRAMLVVGLLMAFPIVSIRVCRGTGILPHHKSDVSIWRSGSIKSGTAAT